MRYFILSLVIMLILPLNACKDDQAAQDNQTKEARNERQTKADEGKNRQAVQSERQRASENSTENEGIDKEEAIIAEAVDENGFTMRTPPAFMVKGKVLDPICFTNDLSGKAPEYDGDGESYYAVENCRSETLNVTPIYPSENPDFVSASYEDATQGKKGFISYQFAGNYKGSKGFLILENTGGSGVFSSFSLFNYTEKENPEGTAHYLEKVRTIAAGDRCTGGIVEAHAHPKGLIYKVNLTPYDLLNILGPAYESEKTQEVSSCATCCYAYGYYKNDQLEMVTLNTNYKDMLKPDQEGEDETVMGCIDGLFALNMLSPDVNFKGEDLEVFIREIEHVCLGRIEGE